MSKVFLLLFLVFGLHRAEAQTVFVEGTVLLGGQTQHGGVTIEFEPLSPSSRAATLTSNADGTWFKTDVNIGIYNIRFRRDGYVPGLIPNVFISRDTTFVPLTLRPGGSAEISGSQFGLRDGTTITLSGDTLYFVRGDLTVNNRTLVIEAGAELRFDRGTGLSLTNSTLDIRGTERDSVLFSSGAPTPNFGDWKGVTVTGGSNHRIHGATFEYGEIALHVTNASNVDVRWMRSDKPQLNRFPVIFDQITGLEVRESWFTANRRPVLDIRRTAGILVEGNTFVGGVNQLQIVGATEGARIERNTFTDFSRHAIIGYYESGLYSNEMSFVSNSGDYEIDGNLFFTSQLIDYVINFNSAKLIVISNRVELLDVCDVNKSSGIGFVKSRSSLIAHNNYELNSSILCQIEYYNFIFDLSGNISMHDNNIKITLKSNYYIKYIKAFGENESEIVNNIFEYFSDGYSIIQEYLNIQNVYNVNKNDFVFNFKNNRSSRIDSDNRIINFRNFNENLFIHNGESSGSLYDYSTIVFQNTLTNQSIKNNIFYSSNRYDNRYMLQVKNEVNFENNFIVGRNALEIFSLSSRSLFRNNLFYLISNHELYNNELLRAIRVDQGSQIELLNNTIINRTSLPSVGVEIVGLSSARIINNHLENLNIGVNALSGPNLIENNNFINNENNVSGNFVPQFVGLWSTLNNNGSSSDIYFNINESPQFIKDLDGGLVFGSEMEMFTSQVRQISAGLRGGSFYSLSPTSPLINAGSDRFTDPDGTRSDIGAFPFDFGNPKRLRLVEALEGGITVAFDPVERDSVLAYRVYGAVQGQEMAFLQTVPRGDTTFTLTNLPNNTPFAVQMTATFPNTESIRSITAVFRAGVQRLEIATPRIIARMGTDTLRVEEITLRNTGTRTLEVQLDARGDTLALGQIAGLSGPTIGRSGKMFYASNNYLTWPQSLEAARAVGLDLISVPNAQVNEDIRDLFGYDNFWIGAYSPNMNCVYQWSDGTPWRYTSWASSATTDCSNRSFVYTIAWSGAIWERGSGGTLRFLASPSRINVPHRLSQTQLTIEPGQSVTVRDTLISRFNQHLSSHLLVRSNDPLAPVDSIFFALVRGVEPGLSPVYFDAAPAGGAAHVLVLEGAEVDGTQMVAGDEVALYSGGRLVASASFNGTFPILLEARGFTAGDSLFARLYRAQTGELVDVRPSVRRDMHTYTENGYSVISLRGTQRVPNTLTLPANRFSMVSTFVDLPDRSFAAHLSGIGTSIVQDDEGRVWIPAYNINTLGAWSTTRGYALYRTGESPVEVTLTGKPLVQAQHPIPLFRNRFFLMPHLYSYPVRVQDALADLASGLSIVQDDEGLAWIPALNVNTLGEMRPGKAYQAFYTGTATTFTFPDLAPATQNVAELPALRVMASSHYGSSVRRTGLPWNVIVTAWPSSVPVEAELSLWDGDLLVGAAQRAAGHTVVTAWRGDPTLELAGFRPGHPVQARYWNPATQTEHDVQIVHPESRETLLYGEGAYALALVEGDQPTSAEADLPLSISLDGIYPNPFQRVATVHFSIPEPTEVAITVYNLLGQRVLTLAESSFGPGRHRVEWDAQNLASGVYVVHFTTQGYSAIQRMTLVK